MRKVLAFLVALLFVLGLTACGDKGIDFPTFQEKNVVELSAQQMVELFESVDYSSVDSESVKIQTKGHVFVKELDEDDDSVTLDAKITVDAQIYALMSETIGEVRLFTEGTVDLDVYEKSWDEETDVAVKGKMGAYFVDSYLYVMVDGSYQEGTEELEEVSFKEKLNQEVTQAMLDDAIAENLPTTDPSEMDGMIPSSLLETLENLDLEELMETIPNLKVYKDGNTHSIVFSVTKQVVLDSLDDFISMYFESMEIPFTEAEVTSMVTEATTEINNVIKEAEFTYVISIEGNKITQMAEKLLLKSVDGFIDIDMTTVIAMGVESPKFPTNLDTYEVVDEIGEGVMDKESVSGKA